MDNFTDNKPLVPQKPRSSLKNYALGLITGMVMFAMLGATVGGDELARLLNVEVATIDTNIGDIETLVTSILASINDGNTDSALIATAQGTIATEIGTIDTAITSILASINDGNTDSALIATAQGTIATEIGTIDTAITSMLASINDGNTDSALIATAQGTIATEIGTIDTAITSILASINDGNTDSALIAVAQDTIATQMALLVTATNNVADYAVDQTNECWFLGTADNHIVCEGASADAFEQKLNFADPQIDGTAVLGNFTGSVLMMIADTGVESGFTLVSGSSLSNCTVTITDDTLIAGGVLKIHATGTFAGGNAPGEVHLNIDGTDICTTVQATAGADDWVWNATMYQDAANAQKVDCHLAADTDAAVVSTYAADTTDFAGGDVVVVVGIESGHGSDTTTLEACQIYAAP